MTIKNPEALRDKIYEAMIGGICGCNPLRFDIIHHGDWSPRHIPQLRNGISFCKSGYTPELILTFQEDGAYIWALSDDDSCFVMRNSLFAWAYPSQLALIVACVSECTRYLMGGVVA